jgi:hypothetical protein
MARQPLKDVNAKVDIDSGVPTNLLLNRVILEISPLPVRIPIMIVRSLSLHNIDIEPPSLTL